jgi:hypothetical protein
MFRAATAPEFRPDSPAPRRARRYPLVRRDPRRFARGMMRLQAIPLDAPVTDSNLRFFAHSFAATFLFIWLLIA